MTKTKQRRDTVFQQGFADGQKDRPFRYQRGTKRRRGLTYSHLYWYYTAYEVGYRLGQESLKPFRLFRVNPPPWIVKTLTALLGGLFIISLYALGQ